MVVIYGGDTGRIPPSGTEGTKRQPPRKTAVKTHTFTIGPEPFDEDEGARWLLAHMQYPNLAVIDEIAESAVAFVKEQRTWFEAESGDVKEKWRVLDFHLRGNSTNRLFPDSDIALPELYKAVEALVPRIVEPVMQYDPWFHVEGRDRSDRRRTKRIAAWLAYQLDLAGFEDKLEEIVRCLLVYQHFAVKTWWDLQYRTQVVRDVEKSTKDGMPQYRITPREEKTLVYEGMKMRLVNPYNFICDTRHTDPADMLFIGDTNRDVPITELRRLEDLGVYTNVDQVAEQTQASTGVADKSAELSHSLGHRTLDPRYVRGQPSKHAVTEIWANWRPTEDEDYDEYVITVVDDRIAVRVQKNFYDDKHRPYAVARAAKEPFDFWNVGVLDHAIRIANELDVLENLAIKSTENSTCPSVFVGHDFDGPANLWDVAPGAVFHSNNTPTWHKAPSIIGDYLPAKESLRREIEETIGVPRLYEGGETGGGGTATETERRIQESNRRTRRLVMSTSGALVKLLQHDYSLSRQFVTARKKFRVLGRAAARLGTYTTLQPEDLGDPVDIKITGLQGLQHHGLRTTQTLSVMNAISAFIPGWVDQGLLNSAKFGHFILENALGFRIDEDILSDPEPLADLLDPDTENMLMGMGQEVEVHEQDPDAQHAGMHKEYFEDLTRANDPDQDIIKLVYGHLQWHLQQMKQKALRRQAQGNRAPEFDIGGAVAQQQAGGNGRYQETPDLRTDVTQTTPSRETPGPPRVGSTPAADRKPPVNQTENRSEL